MSEPSVPPYPGPERRRDKRRAVALAGHIFCTEKGEDAPCTLINISIGGAAVSCAHPFSPRDTAILDVEGLGRFAGTVVATSGDHVSIQFEQGERARKLTAKMIARYRRGRLEETPQLRAARHIYEPVMSRLTYGDGRTADCEIADISMKGAFLRTAERPPLNDVVHIGLSVARVVLYREGGIGVEFITRRSLVR